jgi:hypothetical protein
MQQVDITESLDLSVRICASSDMAWRWLQSHLPKLRHKVGIRGNPTESDITARYARRALLCAAVFDARDQELWAHRPSTAASVATGVLAEVREHTIALDCGRGIEHFALSPSTVAWLGAPATPSALRRGDPVIIRHRTPDPDTPTCRLAERIWARTGRVTGTIVAADGHEFLVDAYRREKQRVVIAPASLRQIQVRFPRLAPGYLLDVIGTRHGDYLLAVAPATAQPPYHAGHSPRPPLISRPVAMPVSGSAVWHEPDDEPPGLLGLAYPAVDPEAGTRPAGAQAPGGGPGCVRLPYLSLGSAVRIRNECADRAAVLPVTSDGIVARQFCDRCVECGTSPKGRVADLTMTAFVELGGNLEDGCFNATLTTMTG